METNNQIVDDSELPLEQNFYDHDGHNICECADPSFMTINFYNVTKCDQDFILGILKQFNYEAHSKLKVSDNFQMVCINI